MAERSSAINSDPVSGVGSATGWEGDDLSPPLRRRPSPARGGWGFVLGVMVAAGVEHLTPIRPLGPALRAFFFADPNGIVLEVMSPPEPGTWLTSPVLDDPDPAY